MRAACSSGGYRLFIVDHEDDMNPSSKATFHQMVQSSNYRVPAMSYCNGIEKSATKLKGILGQLSLN